MSSNGRKSGPDFEVDQSADDDMPLKVVHARKATTGLSLLTSTPSRVGFTPGNEVWHNSNLPIISGDDSPGKIMGNSPPNDNSSPFKTSFSTSAFRSIESPFKPVPEKLDKKFSATPGPAKKLADNLENEINANRETPIRSNSLSDTNQTPIQYNMFKSDDGWSNVRKVTNNGRGAFGSPTLVYMSPLMHSMVDQVVDHQSPAPAPAPAGSIPSHRKEQVPVAAPTMTSELDICDVAKDLDATRFHDSLAHPRAFGNSHSSNSRSPSSGSLKDFGIGKIANSTHSRTLFEDADISSQLLQDDVHYWNNGNNHNHSSFRATGAMGSSILDDETHNITGGSQFSFTGRSFPPFVPERIQHSSGFGGSITSTSYYDREGGNISFQNNSSFGKHDESETSSALQGSGFPVKHSFPPYGFGSNGSLRGIDYEHSRYGQHHQQYPLKGLYEEPLRQNWIDEQQLVREGSSDELYEQQNSAVRSGNSSRVEDYSEITSHLSHDFMSMHGPSGGGRLFPPAQSSAVATGTGTGTGTNVVATEQPLETTAQRYAWRIAPVNSAGFNPAAPAFQPQLYGQGLPPFGSSSSSAVVGRDSNMLGSDAVSHFRPPQQTRYEPPLPTSSSIRVTGRHRQARSDGSFDPRGSGERSRQSYEGGNQDLRSSTNSMLSSIDSDTSLTSNPRLLLGKDFPTHSTHLTSSATVSASAGMIHNHNIDNNSASTRGSRENLGKTSSSISVNTQTIRVPKEASKQAFGRPDLIESPRSKNAHKTFYREFKAMEKVGIEAAMRFAENWVETAPENSIWRVYLEMADLAKRKNQMVEARKLYSKVCRAQPKANLGYLEWSKMEEENGNLRRAFEILKLGLRVCSVNEALMTKMIKLQERLHRYGEVRGILSRLRNESIDKIWKSVLEGSLFEARTGNIAVSRKLFKYLINHVPWYGPIYFEAFRLEEKEGNDKSALEIILKGLNELPRYGPLWFGLFRIMEKRDVEAEYRSWLVGDRPQLWNLVRESADAVRLISKELTWRVHFERSQAEERAAEVAAIGLHQKSGVPLLQCRDVMLGEARQSLVRALLSCPANLRWRVLLVGARMELGVGIISKARSLLQKALVEVPIKSKAYVYLECSRVEEYLGNGDTSRVLLQKARQEVSREWKVCLEVVLIEARAGFIEKAARIAREGLKQHSGTGRLWATYIQLCHRLEIKYFYEAEREMIESKLRITKDSQSTEESLPESAAQYRWLSKERVIRRAIAEVPKSGEVWCERGRCQLNPLSVHCFDLKQAQQSLCFATQFTPQYGDTFIEYVRLEMLCQVLLPAVLEQLQLPYAAFVKAHISEDVESDLWNITSAPHALEEGSEQGSVSVDSDREKRKKSIMMLERMQFDPLHLSRQYEDVIIRNLNRRCVNADPNYGSAWFHCREQPYDIPTKVLHCAVHRLVHELTDTQKIYTRAIFHYIRRCLRRRNRPSSSKSSSEQVNSPPRSSSAPTHRKRPDHSKPQQECASKGVSKSLNLPAGSLAERASGALNTSVFVTSTAHESPVRGEHSDALNSTGEQQQVDFNQIDREEELLEDIAEVEAELVRAGSPGFNEVCLIPFVDVGGGSLFSSADFVTGMVGMNRNMCTTNLPAEVRRKLLFGSDQIVT